MLRTYKFRIYPNKKQELKLLATLNLCRFTYNSQLELKIDRYKKDKINLTQFDLNNNLILLKEEYPELKDIYAQTLQDINKRISLAFDGFYRRIKQRETPGFPRFKSKHRYDSITYPQFGFNIKGHMLVLSKFGSLNIVIHREIKENIKTLTIKKTPSGKWFAYFSVEQKLKKHFFHQENVVGIDLGLIHFYVDSQGHFVDAPKYLRESEQRLKKLQRKHSRKQKGSKNRNKSRLKLATLHEKIVNQRTDFLHQQSRLLVDRVDVLVVEHLQIKNMTQNHYLAKSIHDASWNTFLQFLSYKAEEAGKKIVEINPKGTSQVCLCGKKVEKSLAVRVHRCTQCGIEMDRDLMSALVIKQRVFEKIVVPQDLREFKPDRAL